MKDTEIMTEEEKRKYIFEDTRFEGRPPFNWITDCLLGDIRTFLDGIEYFIIQKKGGPAGKSPRGGGNLSVPILINTALEFISDLYAGKTQDEYMKFSLHKEESYVSDLNDGNIPEDLKKEFEKRRFPLPKNQAVDVTTQNQEWKIKNTTDTESSYYFINLTDEGEKLKIHFLGKEGYRADDIVKPFINAFFPKEYREIPRLLWDGIRNGLVHTFSPKPFEYKGSYIQFQFYVEDQNFPSHIEKVNNTILIKINVFELYRILEKAIEAYRAELENSDDLQKKFIRAFSSIEDYQRDINKDPKKSVEAEKMCDYLDSNSSTLLLKDLNDQLSVDILKIYSLNSLKVRRS